jgi:hypothetical protein
MTKCEHDPLYTGEIRDGQYVYKCKLCGKEFLLDHGEEAITAQPTIPKIVDDIEDKEWAPKERTNKTQSDYHTRRYQLMKTGQWTGSMRNAQI